MHVGVDWKYCWSCLWIYVADPKLKDVADPQGLLRGSPGFLRACCAAFLRNIVCWRYCIAKFPCGCIKRMRGCLSFGVNSKCRRMPGLITCVKRMLTPGVGLGDVPLGACSHMTFRMCLLEKQNGNKWGFSISSCGPQNYSLLSMFGISDDILLSQTSSLWVFVEVFLGKTSCSHIPSCFYTVWKMWTLEQKHRFSLCSLASGVYITISHASCLLSCSLECL